MTLQEFIIDTFAENMIDFDDDKVKAMEKEITEYARKKKTGGNCVAISDGEVREFILNGKELLEKLDSEKKERDTKVAKEKAEKIAKEIEKERVTSEGEQLSLF